MTAIRTLLRVAIVAAVAVPFRPACSQSHRPAQRIPLDTALELASFDSAWTRIRDTYYDPAMHGLDWNRVRAELRPEVARARTRDESRAAIGKMLDRIGDSHFGLLPNADATASADNAGDRPGDVGVELRLLARQFVVVRVDSAGSAARAGVRPGWVLERIDTLTAVSLLPDTAARTDIARRVASLRSLLSAVRRLQGAPGSSILLGFRDGQDRRVAVTLVRQQARGEVVRLGQLPPMPTWLESRRVDVGHGCVGVIRFNMWMTAVATAFEDAVNELRGCGGIVLDLRGNVGGVAAMIVGFTGHFVDRELPLGTMRTRTNELRYTANPRRVRRDGTKVEPFTGPLALIVDELSASTTEIFASALQHHGRARIFGDTTAGQALPSLVMPLPNGDAMLYAIADLADPGGRRLEGRGVIPDERVPLTRQALLAGRDEPIAAALRWIAGAAHPPAR
jgi:carboxyl-terminal processing protease